ncbi:MAG: alpha/beta hydrolase, partial [Acidimicrobiia bacterium]
CPFEGLELGPVTLIPEDDGFECGYVTVPERHADPDGATINIPVAIRRGEGAGPVPLFLAQGGPGGSAFEIFSILTTGAQAASGRDIVIFNQRGTSFATPDLSCTESFDAAAELLEADDEEAERLAMAAVIECRHRLAAEGVDLSAFNSVENAADIPVLASALGYQQIDFYGVSYGTLLGLHLMRDHPEALRSVILDAVVPTQLNFIPEVTSTENRVWSEVFAHCAADPVCSTDYPDLEARVFTLVERLDADPLIIEVADSDTGASAEASLTGGVMLDLMFQLMYTPGSYAFVPRIIADLEAGDTTALEFVWPLLAYDRTFAEGMYYSVICAEDADFAPGDVNLDGVRPALAEGAADELAAFLEVCGIWDVDELDDFVDTPVASDVPTLVLSGRFDPITPPVYGEQAAATLSNATVVVHPYGAHGVAFDNPCIDQVMTAFLTNPDATVDTSCVGSIGPEETVPADAVTLAIVGAFGMLDSGFLLAAALSGLAVLFTYTTLPVAVGLGIRQANRPNRPPAPPAEPSDGPLPLQPLPPPVAEPSEPSKLIRWPMTLGLGAAYGLAATILAFGLAVLLSDVAFNRTAYLGAMALPPEARWLLPFPWLLAVLAVAITVVAVRRWSVKQWSVWGKLYTTLLALAAVAGVVLAAGQGLFGI